MPIKRPDESSLLIRSSIRSRIILLVSAVIVPVILFAVLLLATFQSGERTRAQDAAFDVMRRATAFVDREVAEMTAALEVLATAPSLVTGDLAAFDLQARAVLQTRGRFISMRDRQGQQIVNSNLPFGTPLPIATDPVLLAADARVIASGRLAYSDVFIGTTTNMPFVTIGVPVRRNGEVVYALTLTIDPARLASLLADAAPPDWTVSLVDRRDRIIARSRQHERFINSEATETFRRNAVNDSGSYTGTSLEGVDVFTTYVRSNVTGWRIAVGVPVAVINAPFNRARDLVLVSAAFVLGLSLLLAALVSRGIARPLQAVAAMANKLGQGQAVSTEATGLWEADAISLALAQAAQRIKERETWLRDTETRYRQALEVGKIGAWETDFAKQERRWSPEAMAIFGLSLPGGVGRVGGSDDEWRSALHEGDANMWDAFFTSQQSKDEQDIEYRIRRPDGAVVFLHGHARVVERDVEGQPLRTINVVADITSRRTAERALHASEAQLRAIIANAPIGIILADERGAIYGGNVMAEVICGHPILHSSGKDSYGEWVSFHADGRRVESHEYPLARALGGEEHPSLDVHYQRPDGSRVWISIIGAVMRDEADHIVGALVAVVDIDAERRATEGLATLNTQLEQRVAQAVAERRLLADVIDHTTMFVHIIGLDWRWMAINKAAAQEFARIYGVRPQVGDDIRELLHAKPEHRAAIEAVWMRALGGEEFVETAEFGDPSLDRRVYEMRTYALRDADGKQIGAYQFVTDVSERMESQRKLSELQKMDSIGRLTGGVAHDFNNLLSAILSNLGLARKRIDDLKTAKLIDGAIKGAERGAILTGRLLAFARRQDLVTQAVDLKTLVEGMEELLVQALGAGVQLKSDIPNELPPVMIDANQFELALLNLAVNARDAMTGGNGAITLTASTHEQSGLSSDGLKSGSYVEVRLTDTGQGMDQPTLKRAIEPFFTTKGVGKGTGLGLSMVHGLVSQSGGVMRIESTIGQGTTISLYLPQAIDEPVSARPDRNDVEFEPTSPTHVILVVDDDILVGMGTAAMLEDLGHDVLEATSGSSALAILAERPDIDIVITDHSMPGMTGVQLAQQIRHQRPRMPIILATGYAELPYGETTDLPRLAKPFHQTHLAAIIAKVVGSREDLSSPP